MTTGGSWNRPQLIAAAQRTERTVDRGDLVALSVRRLEPLNLLRLFEHGHRQFSENVTHGFEPAFDGRVAAQPLGFHVARVVAIQERCDGHQHR
jgi:hypothetical protein